MAFSRRLVEFVSEHPSEVVAAIDALAEGEWVNIEPFVDQHELDALRERTPHPLVRMFAKAGAPIPLATVMRTKQGYSLGLEHGHGARVLPVLRERGAVLPAGWVVKQDHPRRGVVIEADHDADIADALGWLLGAARTLSAVAIGDQWTALVFTTS
jgi:hypothetical protein